MKCFFAITFVSTFKSLHGVLSNSRRFVTLNKRPILALDFDGVVCASSTESSYTAIVGVESYWPHIKVDDSIRTELRDAISILRPVVETGFENMLLCRVLIEQYEQNGAFDVAKLTNIWNANYRDELLSKFAASKSDMIRAFGEMRDVLIAKDLPAWIAMNKLYGGPARVLQAMSKGLSMEDLFIVTTKQERFVREILSANGITPPPTDKIFDLDSGLGPKPKVLEHILSRYSYAATSATSALAPEIHFVEDRMETLLAVAQVPGLQESNVRLYLVDWGYNTAAQREEAKRHSRIQLINEDDFVALVSEVREAQQRGGWGQVAGR